MTQILQTAGFELRKFNSNIPELRDQMESTSINLSDESCKALGIKWNPDRDTFSYSSQNIKLTEPINKRSVVSATAKLYDPLGLIAPVVIIAKLFIQELWITNLEWDNPLPDTYKTKWINFIQNLHFINNISVPRKIIISNYIRVELHAFSDASERAYGTCIYIKTCYSNNETYVSLLAAKSRVAPLKKVTLPRLELCAAVLSAQLVDKF